MDNLVFEESVNAEIDQSEFISKKWIYVNDSNSQNYTSQIVIDSTPLSNSGAWINWQEGYILMPLVVELTATTAASLPVNTVVGDNCWAFKNGFWQMINSMTIEFNNQNVVQQTPFLNVFRSFISDVSFSLDNVLNDGTTIGYAIDNPSSWSYLAAANTASSINGNGIGLCNNRQSQIIQSFSPVATGAITTATPFIASTAFMGNQVAGVDSTGTSNPTPLANGDYSHNDGIAKRSKWYGYDAFNDLLGQALVNNYASGNTVYRSQKIVPSIAGSVAWAVYAKLRLKDLSDFFNKTPLLKGSTIRFYINTNQATVPFTTTAPTINAAGVPTAYPGLAVGAVSVLGGLTNPLMVASASVGQGTNPLCNTAAGAGQAGAYTLSVSIVKSNDNLYSTALKSCRLYAPVYKMNPLAEQRYLQLAPTKKIDYLDIFQYQFNEIAGNNTSFNLLVTNGITDIHGVLVCPFIANSANGTGNVSTLLSPFSTSGGSPDPITLTNFNILVSGINLFLNNEYYDFEQFNQELKSSYQLNGNLTTGLTSGLISEDMFSRGKRWYYGNCARVLPSEVGVSRSVQIQGQNASLLACNLMVFVIFKRSITIDISTGARIE